MGFLVGSPNDVLIFGRAVGMRHVPVRDDASKADIKLSSWKAKWPHYIRVHHGEFISGNLSDGVSLNELMYALGSDAFASTQRNAANRIGNTDPRRAYRQKASVELTPQGIQWLNDKLENAFEQHGMLAPAALKRLK